MHLIHTSTNALKEAVIEKVEDIELKAIKKSKRFKFDWNMQKGTVVYKLRLKESDDVLGLLSITIHEKEQ